VSELASVFRLNKPSRYALRVGATLIVDDGRCTLVDPGYFETTDELNAALQQAAGLESDAITDVFYTHLHYDHYSPLLFGRSGLTFHMPLAEYAFITELMKYRRDGERFHAFLQNTHEVIAPVFLRQFLLYANDPRYDLDNIADSNRINLCAPGDYLSRHVKTLDLPGHCPGQLGLEIQTGHGNAIVAGDAVICFDDYLAQDTHHHLIVYDRQQLLESRQRVAQADFVIPGHGDWFAPKRNTLFTLGENS